MVYWYDHQLIDRDEIILKINDPGLIYGATVFTTLRVYQQNLDHPLTHWLEHLNRLKTSLSILEWPFENWQALRQGAQQLALIYPILRIVIFPDGKEWITGRFLRDNLITEQQDGIIGWVANDLLFSRSLAIYKTGNYLGAWLGLQKAQKLGAQEAILIDDQGNWLETCTGNLWGWKDNCWYLPPENKILSGIMRSHLLKGLKQQAIEVKEMTWTPQLVEELEIIAYSNCGVEITPFRQIINSKTIINYNPYHPSLSQLKSLFN